MKQIPLLFTLSLLGCGKNEEKTAITSEHSDLDASAASSLSRVFRVEDGHISLHQCNTPEELSIALSMGADLNALNDWGRTPLENFAESYLEGGPNAAVRKELCATLMAANAKITVRARILLDHPTTPEEMSEIVKTSDPGMLVESACRAGRLTWLELLVPSSVDANYEDGCGVPILCTSAGFSPLVEYLVAQGATVNKRIKFKCQVAGLGLTDGATALHFAARNGNARSIEILCTHGADPSVQEDLLGQSPLHIAAFYGRGQAVKSLLEYGVHADVRNAFGNTAAEVVLAQFRNSALLSPDSDTSLAISLLNPNELKVESFE